ncbi:MAG: (d)CMP kinase [Pseudonocardiales bacterium]
MSDDHDEARHPRFTAVVAIDGPSGAGKSTVARQLALRLGARYLDTGAMYRAVTWAVLQAGCAPDDHAAVTAIASARRVTVSTDARAPAVRVDGHPVDAAIRGQAVTAAVSAVSAVPAVRDLLVGQQRVIIGDGGIVVEGRDIGAVVAPAAAVKVFLTADTGVRAGRRGAELGVTAPDQIAATEVDLSRRDRMDSSRTRDPLTPAADAVILDTNELSVDDVVARLLVMIDETTANRPQA